LTDYHHIHPKKTDTPGVYIFDWSPKTKGSYKMWADVHPKNGVQEYAHVDLTTGSISKTVEHDIVKESTVDDYTFTISFEKDSLKPGEPAMGEINITDKNGNPVKDLQPVMGAFAHIVGFSDDLKTVVHVHPMGKEPSKNTDRGGPTLSFHIEPKHSGFIKLFAQVNIKGKEIFAPFGLVVEPSQN
jgi:hypothetical protein